MKILKNTTLIEIELDVLGISIESSSQVIINVDDYILLATEDSLSELSPMITSGDIIVNDGNNDLNVSNGIDYIRYPDNASNIMYGDTGITLEDTIENNDYHSGYSCIFEDVSIEIKINRQSITKHMLKHSGFIKHSGFLRRNWWAYLTDLLKLN